MTLEQKKTPSRETGGIPKKINHHSHHGDTSSVADSVSQGEVFAQMLHGVHVVVAEIKSPGPEPRFRRHFYMNLSAAQRRVDRATQDGKQAYMYLAQLHVVGDDLD